MSTRSARALLRLFTVALLLLLGSDAKGRAGVSVETRHGAHPGIAAANQCCALLATTPEWKGGKDGDTAPLQLLASEAVLHGLQAQSDPTPTRDSLWLCSCERTPGQSARPPPFQI